MPPKKPAKGKREDGSKLEDKELLRRAEADLIALHRLLELRTLEAAEARQSEKEWRHKADVAAQALQKHKDSLLDITADMKRQHQEVQDQLNRRVHQVEQQNSALVKEVEEKENDKRQIQLQNDALEARVQAQVSDYNRRVEQMQAKFAKMLQETVTKLNDRLEHDLNSSYAR